MPPILGQLQVWEPGPSMSNAHGPVQSCPPRAAPGQERSMGT